MEHPTPHIASPLPSPGFNCFDPVNEHEVKLVILSASDATCSLDFIPTKLLKKCLHVLLPVITEIINLCISEATFPAQFKHAIVYPLLKNHNLSKDELHSYRPISNLNFISKILERIIYNRLIFYLNSFSGLSIFQSAYKKLHSVETALLRVQNDLLLSFDKKEVSALVLLDMSAAFDTVNHQILLSRLSLNFGISGPALSLLTSYLSNRTQSVCINNFISEPSFICTGVPQGSVLGPLLFNLYTTPLSYLLSDSNIPFHFYADDGQLYLSFSASDSAHSLTILSNTLDMVHSWLSRNYLCLNPSKTEFLIIGSKQQRSKILENSITFSGATVSVSSSARNLGVIFDSDMSFSKQISTVSKSCFYTIRHMRQIRSSLDFNSAILLANALVSSKIDFCNSLYFGLPSSAIQRLQRIQNALARVVCTGIGKHDPITPILQKLHWLPVEQRISYKVSLLTFKTLQYQSPTYLSELLIPQNYSRTLRANDKNLLHVPRVDSKTGRRSFSFVGPSLWNSLPDELRLCDSLSFFRKKLKTHFYPP